MVNTQKHSCFCRLKDSERGSGPPDLGQLGWVTWFAHEIDRLLPDGVQYLLDAETAQPAAERLYGMLCSTLGEPPPKADALDASMIEGEVEVLEIDALPQERGDRFVAHTGFDPRALATPYRWFGISPRRS